MKMYKVVPCQSRVVANDLDEAASRVSSLSNVILREAVGGWELIATMPVLVCNNKCGAKAVEEPYNALIFARDEIKEIPGGSALAQKVKEYDEKKAAESEKK